MGRLALTQVDFHKGVARGWFSEAKKGSIFRRQVAALNHGNFQIDRFNGSLPSLGFGRQGIRGSRYALVVGIAVSIGIVKKAKEGHGGGDWLGLC